MKMKLFNIGGLENSFESNGSATLGFEVSFGFSSLTSASTFFVSIGVSGFLNE